MILSPKGAKLLELLILKKNSNVSNEEIIITVWENDFNEEISKDSVKSQISYLRKSIPNIVIQNVYGIGYKLKI